MNITLLGPQRDVGAARSAVTELMPEGQIATINAGWQERETDSEMLNEVLGGRMCNLELYRRWQEILDADAEYAGTETRLNEVLAELQAVYTLRLQHAMAALTTLRHRDAMPPVQQAAIAEMFRSIQALDEWHLRTVAETRDESYARVRLGERDHVVHHRTELARMVGDSTGLVLTGGHVGVLLHLLHVFAMGQLIRPPVIAWSAGAMALSDRVVLFNDNAPHGFSHAEVYADGLGAFSGVLPFPHPRRRLHLSDGERLAQMARRFAPRQCLLLRRGARFDLRDGEPLPAAAPVLAAEPDEVSTSPTGVAK